MDCHTWTQWVGGSPEVLDRLLLAYVLNIEARYCYPASDEHNYFKAQGTNVAQYVESHDMESGTRPRPHKGKDMKTPLGRKLGSNAECTCETDMFGLGVDPIIVLFSW